MHQPHDKIFVWIVHPFLRSWCQKQKNYSKSLFYDLPSFKLLSSRQQPYDLHKLFLHIESYVLKKGKSLYSDCCIFF